LLGIHASRMPSVNRRLPIDPSRLTALDGVLDPTHCIQIGIRGSSEYLWKFSKDSGMTVLHAKDTPHLSTAKLYAWHVLWLALARSKAMLNKSPARTERG
jgi:arginase family enzyme